MFPQPGSLTTSMTAVVLSYMLPPASTPEEECSGKATVESSPQHTQQSFLLTVFFSSKESKFALICDKVLGTNVLELWLIAFLLTHPLQLKAACHQVETMFCTEHPLISWQAEF